MSCKLWLVCSIGIFSALRPCDEVQIRLDFHKVGTKDQLHTFILTYQDAECSNGEPYVASAMMRMAKFIFWPNRKLHYFKKGREKLEAFIEENPECIEARYLRVMVQANVPVFLGYSQAIDTDIAYIENHLSTSALPLAYQQLILKNIWAIKNE